MSRPTKSEQPWFQEAADIMVRESKNLRQAAMDLSVALTSEEADAIFKRKAFQAILRQTRNKYHNEVAADPTRNKTVLVGNLLVIADKLMLEGEYKKASEVLFQVAKIEGYVGAETNVNVFGELTANNFDSIRKSLRTTSPGAPAPVLN